MKTRQATFATGCFWCSDPIFRRIKGVTDVRVGYAGGDTQNPTYKEVAGGETGHAEAVRVTFDPSVVSYEELLDVFFYIHDPTQLNRQGPDVGPQYRSAIFYENKKQKKLARKAKKEAQKGWDNPIVTQIEPLGQFWPAEEQHQQYFKKNPERTYCQVNIAPKVDKFERTFKKLTE